MPNVHVLVCHRRSFILMQSKVVSHVSTVNKPARIDIYFSYLFLLFLGWRRFGQFLISTSYLAHETRSKNVVEKRTTHLTCLEKSRRETGISGSEFNDKAELMLICGNTHFYRSNEKTT